MENKNFYFAGLSVIEREIHIVEKCITTLDLAGLIFTWTNDGLLINITHGLVCLV